MASPRITLHIDLQDFMGEQVGSAANPAYVQINLCNYMAFLPRIPGTSMLGQVGTWPMNLAYKGSPLTVLLYGNDVILPPGTFYAIAILDPQKNVIQASTYVFSGTLDANLSDISPTFPSYAPVIIGGSVIVPFSATAVFNCTLLPGPIMFDMTLTGDVTAPSVIAPQAGQLVTFILAQDGVGGHTFTWPSNVLNGGIMDLDPNSVTVQTFITRATGFLYPIGPQTYN